MSDKLKQLREQRNNLAGEANQLNSKYDADKRMPKDELNTLNGILDKIGEIDAEIRTEERMAETALDNFDQGNHNNSVRDNYTRDPGRQANESSFVRAFMMGGLSNLSQEELHSMRNRTPADIQNAMSTTTPSEGGYTVAEEWMRQLQVAMKAYGGMYSVAEIMRTATGATLNMPTADATSEEGEIVGQNSAVSQLDTSFGNKTLGSFMYSSKSIALPWELLQDSMFDLDAYIMDLLAMRIGRITNRHFTVGTGSGQPEGIVTGAAQGKIGKSGQTLTVTYDDLVALEHSVDPAYRNQAGVGFMFHDSTLEQLRLIKDKNDRPIFVPGYEQGNPGGAPDRLLNRPITINQHMAPMAASAKSILFGQLSKYKIRQVMDTRLFRMTDSKYTEKAQVGFIGYQRADGKLIDVGGAVKYYQNAAS
ncbi:major capsid protein [Vibrio phage Marilyn]|nr:major capsid protein [Vibrio phage Marilyn]WCD55593.1 major capsid protein [Vibrio phage Baybae]